MEKTTASSRNLDLLRSFAVLLVVGFHLAKFFNWQFEKLRVTDFGLLGVMLFLCIPRWCSCFRWRGSGRDRAASLFVPFMIRQVFPNISVGHTHHHVRLSFPYSIGFAVWKI